MPRETRTFTTPVGNQTIEIKTYLIGREKRALQNAFLGKGLDVALDSAAVQTTNVNAASIEAAQEVAWKTVLVSVDGKKDGDAVEGGAIFSICDAILDMRAEDYTAIVDEVNNLTREKKT